MAAITGWIAAAAIVIAGLIPLTTRKIPLHVVLGTITTLLAATHTFVVLPELGSEAAIAGGMLALAPGALAFFVLFAHVGLGLQLRKPKLRDRTRKRRMHLATATTIATAVALHAVLLLRAS